MKLEIQRLKSNLSSAERDRTLLSISVDPATIDPNRILDYSSLISVCNYADTLALLGHTYLEDRENASLGLQIGPSGPVDFWNVRECDDACFSDDCEVKAHKRDINSSDGTSFDCSQCQRNTCRGCCAGMASCLLLKYWYSVAPVVNPLPTYPQNDKTKKSRRIYINTHLVPVRVNLTLCNSVNLYVL